MASDSQGFQDIIIYPTHNEHYVCLISFNRLGKKKAFSQGYMFSAKRSRPCISILIRAHLLKYVTLLVLNQFIDRPSIDRRCLASNILVEYQTCLIIGFKNLILFGCI